MIEKYLLSSSLLLINYMILAYKILLLKGVGAVSNVGMARKSFVVVLRLENSAL